MIQFKGARHEKGGKAKMHKESDDLVVSMLMSRLRTIPKLNVSQAVSALGGSEALYLKMISIMLQNLQQNLDLIQNCLHHERDLYTAAVKMHGLKGVLSQIGYQELALLAKDLEKAAKSGDRNYCTTHFGIFKEELLAFSQFVGEALPATETTLEPESTIPDDVINDLYATILKARDAADDYDSISATELLSPLARRHFGGEVGALLAKAVGALEIFQPLQAADHLNNLLKLIATNFE